MAEWFKSKGYYTLSNGKILHVKNDSPESWSLPAWRAEKGGTPPFKNWRDYQTKENLRIAFWFGSRLENKRDFQGMSGAEPLEEFSKIKNCESNNSLQQPFSFCFSPFLFFFFCVSLVFLFLSISLFLSFQFSFPPRVLLPLTSQLLPLRLHTAIQNKKPLF